VIHLRGLAFDRKRNPAKEEFARAKKVELFYAARLRQVAKNVGHLIAGFDLESIDGNVLLLTALRDYAAMLSPWAASVAKRMIGETAARDDKNWRSIAARMGVALRKEIETAPTGEAMRKLLAEQIDLIASLPTEAAERVRMMTQQGISDGVRPKEIAARIMETSDVTLARATLIARTEVARTASVLTQVRAQHVGCTHFTWITAGDSNVRPSHRALNRLTFEYANPPLSDPPDHHSLPGQIWNCRCIGVPILESA
jgi:SPP1 gp7 family putative phage head morphogenesis protein